MLACLARTGGGPFLVGPFGPLLATFVAGPLADAVAGLLAEARARRGEALRLVAGPFLADAGRPARGALPLTADVAFFDAWPFADTVDSVLPLRGLSPE